MREKLSDSITKTVVDFAIQFHETEDEFIFKTIGPFCIDIHQGYNAGLNRAIEIVKRGGRDEK